MLAKRFYNNSTPTILDVPRNMAWDAVGLPDPETPVGARGIGEPPVASGCTFGAERDFRCARRRGIRPLAGSAGSHRQALDTKKPGQVPLTANV